MPKPARLCGRVSWLNCGWARDIGILRMSMRRSMGACLSSSTSSSRLRLEWPTVKKGSFTEVPLLAQVPKHAAPVRGDVIRLVAFDLVLRVVLRGAVHMTLVIEVAGMDGDHSARDVACLGVPADVIADLELPTHLVPACLDSEATCNDCDCSVASRPALGTMRAHNSPSMSGGPGRKSRACGPLRSWW